MFNKRTFFKMNFVNKHKEKIMKIEILNTCTACGLCENVNSDVFQVNGISKVNNNKISGNEEDCRNAAAQCPVGAIKIYE